MSRASIFIGEFQDTPRRRWAIWRATAPIITVKPKNLLQSCYHEKKSLRSPWNLLFKILSYRIGFGIFGIGSFLSVLFIPCQVLSINFEELEGIIRLVHSCKIDILGDPSFFKYQQLKLETLTFHIFSGLIIRLSSYIWIFEMAHARTTGSICAHF